MLEIETTARGHEYIFYFRFYCQPSLLLNWDEVLDLVHRCLGTSATSCHSPKNRNFWWPATKKRIIEYIHPCLQYQKDKTRCHQQYGLISPLELLHTPMQSISMDFITGLPLSGGCDELWVIVDRFSKMTHFVPLLVGSKTAASLAKISAREIWRLHGLPQDIVSDRDSRFTSAPGRCSWQGA